jgi:hypothetical protein
MCSSQRHMLHPRLYCETEEMIKEKSRPGGGCGGDDDGDPRVLSIFFLEIN